MYLVEFLVELLELSRFGHDILVHEEWSLQCGVTSLIQPIQGVHLDGVV